MDPRTWLRDLTWYFMYLLFISTIGPLLFGFHLSELNTPEDIIRCKKYSLFPDATSPGKLPQCLQDTKNPTLWGLIGSIFTLGGLLGALCAGPLSARYGRLPTMRYTTIFFGIGPVFEALAPGVGVMTLGRFISGIGAGAAVVVVPIYVSEVAPPAEKGFFGSFTQVMINVGILIAQLLGYFMSHGQYWRVVLATGGVIGILQFSGLFLAVESPKWLADEGHPVKAKRILRKIRGNKFDLDEEVSGWGCQSQHDIQDEEETLLNNEDHESIHSNPGSKIAHAKKEVLSIIDVIRHPEYNKAAIAVMMVMLAQQLCGINSIIMYGVGLLSDLLKANSAILNLGVSAVNIIVTAGCAPLVDKLGRKTCLLNSIAGMGISSLLLAFGIMKSVPILSAVAVVLFVASFGLGLGPVPFILSSELVGPEAVGATQSLALASNWIATFLVAQFFPLANAILHGKVYFIFAGLAAFFWLFTAWFVPETKGKKSIDEVWGREPRRVD